jgi:Mrp family chromosome partitioning ATPase
MLTQSPANTPVPASRRVQVLNRPVDLSTIGDLDIVSVLPSVSDWREWFGTGGPHLTRPDAKTANYAKAIRDLARFVIGKLRPGPAMILTIASPLAQDGRSTVAANLAVACAEQKKRVLLVDSDLYRRALGPLFSTAVRPLGVSNVLTGAVYWRDLVSPHSAYPSLEFLAAGSSTLDDDLPAAELAQILQEARPFYDLILLDSAPLLQHPQTIDLAIASDATLLIARRNHTRQSELVSALGYLRRIEARVLAIALNDA